MIAYGIVYILIGIAIQTLHIFLNRETIWVRVVENKLWATLVANYLLAMIAWPVILTVALIFSLINFRGTP